MATLKTQSWRPDTCGCEVQQIFDYDTNPATLVSQTYIQRCPAHTVAADATPLVENQRKNISFGRLQTTLPELADQLMDESGAIYYKWKDGINVSWAWTGTGDNRILQITITGYTLTNPQRNAVMNWCNSTFGVGKVELIN